MRHHHCKVPKEFKLRATAKLTFLVSRTYNRSRLPGAVSGLAHGLREDILQLLVSAGCRAGRAWARGQHGQPIHSCA